MRSGCADPASQEWYVAQERASQDGCRPYAETPSPPHEIWSEIWSERSTIQFSSVQSLSRVRLFVTPWTAARQASLSITNSRSSLKLMSTDSVMPSNHLILCRPLLLLPPIFPSIRVFSKESLLCIKRPNIGVSASTSVLPMNIQD